MKLILSVPVMMFLAASAHAALPGAYSGEDDR